MRIHIQKISEITRGNTIKKRYTFDMTELKKRYLKSLCIGLTIILAGLFCHYIAPGLKLPAIPGILIPVIPFLLISGIAVVVVSALLFFNDTQD